MGGDTLNDEEESSRSSSSSSSPCSYCFSDGFGYNNGVSEENHVADLRRREKSYQQILQSYDSLEKKSKRKLKLARNQILNYTPGSWSDVDLTRYDVPNTTSILIVGPKGAGKSSLVNRISRVIENDEFAPARAQESYGTASVGGTYFVHEYMIPRGSSASFSLYDTRGLSKVLSSDNTRMIEEWITRGVHHGEPVIWSSDSSELTDRLIRDGDSTGCETKKVNSVIFVVNSVEILKSMESGGNYAHMVSMAFNCPSLSFKDDKPALVMTHGDVLSLEERARVRFFLGEFLGIPPDKQIFDIPDSRDTATALTVCNLLRHSLEHADKNLHFLPKRKFIVPKLQVGRALSERRTVLSFVVLLIFLPLLVDFAAIHLIGGSASGKNVTHENQNKVQMDQSTPRPYNNTLESARLWRLARRARARLPIDTWNRGPVRNYLSDPVPEGDMKIDWRTRRGMWLDEQKVAEAEAEPRFDWRIRRRLWYSE